MERFEIQLSHLCNNRCVFCVSGQMTQLRRTKPTPLPDLQERLAEARARGIDEVTFLGGEPTIHPTFFPILDHAITLGFGRIVIFTNGARLDQPKFLNRILAYGADRFHWRISIQGFDEATHDRTTMKPGAFRRIIAGLETLGGLGQQVEINMCVVEQNYRSLEALPDFVTRHCIAEVHLDMIRPRDAGERTEDYLDGIMPDYADLGRILDRMLTRLEAIAPSFDLRIGNLPFCQAPQWAHRIHHGGATTLTASADGFGEVSSAWDKYEDKRSDKQKLPSCASCVFDPACDGFFELYGRRRSARAFVPVHRSDLRAFDPRQRTFMHQLGHPVRALARRDLDGWSLQGVEENDAHGHIDASFVTTHGGRAWLRVAPAAARDGADGEHDDFTLHLLRWEEVDPARVALLLRATFDALADRLGDPRAHVRRAPDADRMLARHGLNADPSILAPPIRARFVRLLQWSRPEAKWQLSSTDTRRNGASVTWTGPGSIASTLHLVEEGGRFRGRWSFAPTYRAEQRALATAVATLLQPSTRLGETSTLPDSTPRH
jgi:MoaA/NifB/PqqE/SkfB family radical SAM enzyme